MGSMRFCKAITVRLATRERTFRIKVVLLPRRNFFWDFGFLSCRNKHDMRKVLVPDLLTHPNPTWGPCVRFFLQERPICTCSSTSVRRSCPSRLNLPSPHSLRKRSVVITTHNLPTLETAAISITGSCSTTHGIP